MRGERAILFGRFCGKRSRSFGRSMVQTEKTKRIVSLPIRPIRNEASAAISAWYLHGVFARVSVCRLSSRYRRAFFPSRQENGLSRPVRGRSCLRCSLIWGLGMVVNALRGNRCRSQPFQPSKELESGLPAAPHGDSRWWAKALLGGSGDRIQIRPPLSARYRSSSRMPETIKIAQTAVMPMRMVRGDPVLFRNSLLRYLTQTDTSTNAPARIDAQGQPGWLEVGTNPKIISPGSLRTPRSS